MYREDSFSWMVVIIVLAILVAAMWHFVGPIMQAAGG